jgi:hypothetical protein
MVLSTALEPVASAMELPAVMETTRELQLERLEDGHLKVHWPIDAKRLRAKDKVCISPSFELFPGCSFKLMVKPRAMGDKKGQASFHKARGWGSVELKSMEGVAVAPTLRFLISVGGELPRGPVEHDFHNSTVGGLAKSDEMFDFTSAVDSKSSTFVVSLEVLPKGWQPESN